MKNKTKNVKPRFSVRYRNLPDSSTNVTDIPELDAAGYRVFKVKVQMKE